MLSTENEKILVKYKSVHTISDKEKCFVSLVINLEDNQIAVKKVIHGGNVNIYKTLKENPCVNIPAIYHIIEFDDSFTLIEEFIEGLTLQELFDSRDFMTEENLFDVLNQLCVVMKLIHGLPNPIIHRDIKPSNIIISKSGVLKLIDFDAAREFSSEKSGDTVCLGTIEYAAPEQFGYSQTDNRSDIYAIGMVISEFMEKYDEYDLNRRLHSAFQKVIDKCTMFDPNQRFQKIDELENAIQSVRKDLKGNKNFKGMILLAIFLITVIIALGIYKIAEKNDSISKDVINTAQTPNEPSAYPILQMPSVTPYVSVAADNKPTQNDVSVTPSIDLQETKSNEQLEEAIAEASNNAADSKNKQSNEVASGDDSSTDSKEDTNTKKTSTQEKVNNITPTRSGKSTEGPTNPKEDKENEEKINQEESANNNSTEGPSKEEEKTGEVDTSAGVIVNGYKQPVFYTAWNSFYKSNPQDIIIKIVWNDASKITGIISEWTNTPALSESDYIIDSNSITIKKEALAKLDAGEYRWCAFFDTNFGNSITMDIYD